MSSRRRRRRAPARRQRRRTLIVTNGPEYRELGTTGPARSLQITGDAAGGRRELAMGTTLREAIELIGGGRPSRRVGTVVSAPNADPRQPARHAAHLRGHADAGTGLARLHVRRPHRPGRDAGTTVLAVESWPVRALKRTACGCRWRPRTRCSPSASRRGGAPGGLRRPGNLARQQECGGSLLLTTRSSFATCWRCRAAGGGRDPDRLSSSLRRAGDPRRPADSSPTGPTATSIGDLAGRPAHRHAGATIVVRGRRWCRVGVAGRLR